MPGYCIQDIAKIVNGNFVGKDNPVIKYLMVDSRKLISHSGSLFFAIIGERHNGHDFIEDLYTKGFYNFVVSAIPKNSEKFFLANFVVVPDTLKALHQLSEYHREEFNIPIIGITGSNGKTIVKEWLFQLLYQDKKIIRSPKSYNSQIGVPLSVWLLDEEYELAIFEAGISQNGEMEKLQSIIQPNIGVFTNIGEAHQENFRDLEEKVKEKLKLFKNSQVLIYCKDHEIINKQIISNTEFRRIKLFTWSKNGNSDLHILEIEKGQTKTSINGIFNNREIEISIPFIDQASIENSIHVWAVMLFLNYSNEYIKERMKTLSPVAMRLELKQGINNCTIINDSYNSDLGSLNIALDVLNQQHQHARKTLILSDIFQSGRDELNLYSEVAELVYKKNIINFIGIGNALFNNRNLFKVKKHFFKSTNEFISRYSKEKFQDEAILLKGSRNFEFEKISTILEQKAHRTVLEINLNSILHNLNYFCSKLKPSTKIMAIVKAFSYGSGTFEIANLLQFHRVDYLAVAFADEGIALREAGITVPVLVMSPEMKGMDLMIENSLEPEIYSFKVLELFNDAVRKSGVTKFPIHIKLDTGMHRLGFVGEDIQALILNLKKNNNLFIKSVFTHLAASDEPNHDDFTRLQFKNFDKLTRPIIEAFDYPILRHVLNSSGIERFPEAQYDMVRLGIGLYGISTVDQDKLANISTLKSSISQIKTVPANETVGYSRKGKTNEDIRIAIVPIGYADGLNRKLGNGVGKFFLKGKFVPTIGDICMDMCMIDISKVDAMEGDEVIIFGDMYPVSDLARQLHTIPYEVLTGISHRVKRVYYQE